MLAWRWRLVVLDTAHHQLNERIDELNAIRAEMDKPGYPQAD